MCKKDSKIHFCTCSKEEVYTGFSDEVASLYSRKEMQATFAEGKGKYLETFYKWELDRYVEDGIVFGEIIAPSKKMSKLLTASFVEDELNSIDLFDFEYIPKEGDALRISEQYKYIELNEKPRSCLYYNFMSFNFEDGKWGLGIKGFCVYKTLGKGKIEVN